MMLAKDVDELVMREVERIENNIVMNLARQMPRLAVKASEQGAAGLGLFNDTGSTILPGQVLAVLSSGTTYSSKPLPAQSPECGDAGFVQLKGGGFQKYAKTAINGRHGFMGGAANEDKDGLNNAVIVEIDCKNSRNQHCIATVIISSANITWSNST